MRLFAIAIALFLTGCGVREIADPDGSSRTEFFVGLGKTVDCTLDPGLSAEVTTLGAWLGDSGGGLGFHHGRYVCGSSECQVVIWPASEVDAKALRQQLESFDGVCIVD